MADEIHTGRCLCGAVRFEALGAPEWVAHCHCESCRRHTGSAFSTVAGYREATVRWTGERPAVFASAPGVRRGHCSRCGSPISYGSDRHGDEVHLMIGAFDDPGAFEPTVHVWTSEQVSWLRMEDGLPRYATTLRAGREEAASG